MDIYKCPFFSFAYQAFFRCKLNNKLFEYKESTFLVLKYILRLFNNYWSINYVKLNKNNKEG